MRKIWGDKMKSIWMMAGVWLLGSALAPGVLAAEKLEAIRCELNKEEGQNPSELLDKRTLRLGPEPETFIYSNAESGLEVNVLAMSADDDRFALVAVSLALNGYVAESQYFTDGREINDVSLTAPGEAKVTYVVSCYR